MKSELPDFFLKSQTRHVTKPNFINNLPPSNSNSLK